MTDALRRSFAVTCHDPQDPLVIAWLERLTALVAELPESCEYRDTAREIKPVDVIGRDEFLAILRSSGFTHASAPNTAVRVMQVLFDLQQKETGIRVRFYCKYYGHENGVCDCEQVVNDSMFGPALRQYKHLDRARSYRLWFVDRGDLMRLAAEDISKIKCHPNTREHITTIVTWLRQHPNAE
jgi:hypothetical protein